MAAAFEWHARTPAYPDVENGPLCGSITRIVEAGYAYDNSSEHRPIQITAGKGNGPNETGHGDTTSR